MKIQDLIKNIHKGSKHLGTFTLNDLFQFASSRSFNGIAVAKENGREYYLAFLAGEAEGAIYIDDNGTEYSDKAAKMITGNEKFEFYEITPDIIETIVMRCRIFEKTHLKRSIPNVIHDLLDNIIKGSKYVGVFPLHELFQFTSQGRSNGIAAAKENEREYYLAFIDGEAEGAIYIDEKGSLYSDKAVLMITGQEKFEYYTVKPDIVDAVVMGSRIFEKMHLRKSLPSLIPEIGKKSEGMGVLSVTITKDAVPQNGLTISIRNEGKVLGNDITTGQGTASFKLNYGKYDCIVRDRSQNMTTFYITFDESNSKILLDLNVKSRLEI
ncbi:MAG: hypothetical protein M0Q91_00685 [Methanoregula sp.]|jgi:hypothetical protein|nr:hypothetical protein [Methanoregula sp.]